jgi:large subunit ribosomal protein L13
MKKYHLFNAENKILGRLSVEIAKILSGRNKIDYTPHIDGGDFVVVVNSEKLKFSGGKEDKKVYHTYSGYPGGIRSLKLKEKMEKDSRKVIREAVYGMLPKNKLRDEMIKRLLISKDEKHNYKIDINH